MGKGEETQVCCAGGAGESEESRQTGDVFWTLPVRSRISRGTPDQNNKRVGPLWSVARFGPRRCRRCRAIKSYLKTHDLVHISQRRRFWWRGVFFLFCAEIKTGVPAFSLGKWRRKDAPRDAEEPIWRQVGQTSPALRRKTRTADTTNLHEKVRAGGENKRNLRCPGAKKPPHPRGVEVFTVTKVNDEGFR